MLEDFFYTLIDYWVVILIMSTIAIPLLMFIFKEEREYESLDKYYSKGKDGL